MLKVGNKQETLKLNHSLCLAGKVNQVKDIFIDKFLVSKYVSCERISI